MGIEARVQGVDEWKAATQAIRERTRVETDRAVDDSLAVIQQAAQRNLSLTSHPRGTPTPSQPGQPPSLIGGALRRAVKARRLLHGPRVFSGGVGPTIVYGPIQERSGWAGAGHRSFIPARPYLRPARASAIPAIRRIFITAWTRAIRG